jgi:hypothetical protein
MPARRQRATTSQEIMEKDIDVAIKKAKQRYRSQKTFYILKYITDSTPYYFASGYPDIDKTTKQEIFKEKWVFNTWNKIWECVFNND